MNSNLLVLSGLIASQMAFAGDLKIKDEGTFRLSTQNAQFVSKLKPIRSSSDHHWSVQKVDQIFDGNKLVYYGVENLGDRNNRDLEFDRKKQNGESLSFQRAIRRAPEVKIQRDPSKKRIGLSIADRAQMLVANEKMDLNQEKLVRLYKTLGMEKSPKLLDVFKGSTNKGTSYQDKVHLEIKFVPASQTKGHYNSVEKIMTVYDEKGQMIASTKKQMGDMNEFDMQIQKREAAHQQRKVVALSNNAPMIQVKEVNGDISISPVTPSMLVERQDKVIAELQRVAKGISSAKAKEPKSAKKAE